MRRDKKLGGWVITLRLACVLAAWLVVTSFFVSHAESIASPSPTDPVAFLAGEAIQAGLNGVESGDLGRVPPYLDNGDDGISDYAPAKGMHNAGFNQTDVQARTLPFEEHLFDVVNKTLLPDWRSRDWTDVAIVTTIGQEMRRVQEQMDADAYWHLKYLFDHGATSNHAPSVSIDSASSTGPELNFAVYAEDADNDPVSYLFNYGDGQASASATHNYVQGGHYLVSCTVTDSHGVSQTDWLFITLEGTATRTTTPTPSRSKTGTTTTTPSPTRTPTVTATRTGTATPTCTATAASTQPGMARTTVFLPRITRYEMDGLAVEPGG